MRPISLNISAFGPFSGTTTLNFEDLKKHSLFLISGPTGSGKTSILDAMVFALFGETSGRLRNGQTMRSDYATDTMPTVVTFEFAIGDRRYKIERAPKQTLKKKRGVGTREVEATAILWFWEDDAWQEYSSRRTDIANKIQEILGFRVDQFLQVVLLPQGEFRKLLVAPTSEREALMNSLFKTDIFKRLQELLKEEYNQVVASAKSVIDEQQYLLHSEQVSTQVELEELLALKDKGWQASAAALKGLKARYDKAALVFELKEQQRKLEESLLLERKNEADLAAQDEAMQSLGETLAQLKAFETIRLHEAQYADLVKAEERLRHKLQALEVTQKDIESQVEELKLVGKRLEDKKEQYESYQSFLQQADSIQEKYDELLQQKAELRNLNSQLDAKAQLIETQQKTSELKAKELERDQEARAQLSELVQHEALYLQMQMQCQAGRRAWDSWQDGWKQYEELLVRSKGAELVLAKAKTAELEAEHAVLLEKELVSQQEAAVLAERLVLNEPCPVCGSSDHPKKAIYPEQFDKNRLAQLELAYKEALGAHSRAQTNWNHIEEQVKAGAEHCEQAQHQVELWIDSWNEDFKAWEKALGIIDAKAEVVKRLGSMESLVASNLVDGKIYGLVSLEKALFTHTIQASIACVVPIHELEQALETYEIVLAHIQNGRNDLATLEQRLQKSEESQKSLQAELDAVQVAYQGLKNQQVALTSGIETLSRYMPTDDWNAWMAKRKEIESWLKQYKEKLNTYDEKWKAIDREHTTCLANQVNLREQLDNSLEAQSAARKQYVEAVEKAGLSDERLNELVQLSDEQHALEQQWERYKEACVQVRTRLDELEKQRQTIESSLSIAEAEWIAIDERGVNDLGGSDTLLDITVEGKQAGEAFKSESMPVQITEEVVKELAAAYETGLQAVAVNEKEVARLKKVLAQYTALVANNLEITKRSEFLYNLSDMANGGTTGLRGVTFELYVLGAILEEVVSAANLRLRRMSRQRYELQRTPVEGLGRGHRGLDLSVFDNYTGVARPANTLSGGETFLASLSLAMGLADVIQAYAGGVHLDTIFIDEGFGTLDPDSLDVAMESLLELQASGRLVGIISHVPELKSRIPAHLEVKPVEQGSVAKFVVP